jgi:hypothetical protein
MTPTGHLATVSAHGIVYLLRLADRKLRRPPP